jgi:hypothetical protein
MFFALQQAQFGRRTKAGAGGGDPDFSSLVLLVNAEDDPPTDASPFARTCTLANSAVSSATQSKYATRSLSTIGANNAALVVDSAGSTAQLGTGDCTLELWGYRNGSAVGSEHLLDAWPDNFLMRYASGELQFYTFGNSLVMNPSFTWATGVWLHIAVVRVGTTWTLYRDGVSHTSVGSMSGAASSGTGNGMYVGGGSGPNDGFNGYINGARITKGVARYTANFTPSPLPWPTS